MSIGSASVTTFSLLGRFAYLICSAIVLLQLQAFSSTVDAAVVESKFISNSDTLKNGNDFPQRNSSHLKYLGCFDYWKSRLPTITASSYFMDLSLDKCEYFCDSHAGNGQSDLLLTRGVYCGCIQWELDRLLKVDEALCNFDCKPSTSGEKRSCGGRHVMSVYCDPDEAERCANFHHVENNLIQKLEKTASKLQTKNLDVENVNTVEAVLPCYNCTDAYNCYASSFYPGLAYIPDNSPEVCVEFCSKNLEFYNSATNQYEIRERSSYANVGWAFRGFTVATCGCFDNIPAYEEVSVDRCNKPCPVQQTQMCGGDPPYIFTLYRTEDRSI